MMTMIMMMMYVFVTVYLFALTTYKKHGVRARETQVMFACCRHDRTTQLSAHNVLHDRRTAVVVNTSNECLIVQWHYCLGGQGHKPSSNGPTTCLSYSMSTAVRHEYVLFIAILLGHTSTFMRAGLFRKNIMQFTADATSRTLNTREWKIDKVCMESRKDKILSGISELRRRRR